MRIFARKSLVPALISILGTLIALFPGNPDNLTLPSRDSGVFLYVGWRLLNGDIPYRDVWDHKPPLIYFVDALGLLFSPESMLGIWLLQFLFLFLTAFFLYKALEEALGTVPAIAGTVILTSGLLTVIDRGNVTEEYALVFQTLAFWLFAAARRNGFPLRTTFWIGLCGGFAFYFKQTTIGVWIAYALVLIAVRITQRKSPVADLAVLLTGCGLVSLALTLGFASQNALSDFWNQAFQYNFVYVGKHEGISRLIPVFIKGFLYLSRGGVLDLAIGGWLAGLVGFWINRNEWRTQIRSMVFLALLDFPLEVALITISGRSILHYYLTPLPVFAILGGILLYSLVSWLSRIRAFSSAGMQTLLSAVMLCLVLVLQIPLALNYPTMVTNMADNTYKPVIDFVDSHTNPSDRVLVIGAESVVNFLARREAPTRFVYQYPLQLLGRRDMFEEYFQEVLKNKPVLIIDAPGSGSLDENLYKSMQPRSAVVRDGVQYLIRNYQNVAAFGGWTFYRLKQGP